MTAASASILIVDDEIRNRRLLEALLLPQGYETRSAANGEEALALVAELPPDLILLDIMMPGMDGYQVARLLKADAATSGIPIIMVTAQSDRGARLTGLEAGAEEFLTKPVERAELWVRVRNLLRLKAYSDLLQNHSLILEREVQMRTAELQRFRTAMDATADAIVLVNRATMRYMEVNAATCTMLGYSRQELFLMAPSQIVASSNEDLTSTYDALIADPGANDRREAVLLCKDGSERQVEVYRQAMLSGTDWIIVGVVRDITDRKLAEEGRRAMVQLLDNIVENIPTAVQLKSVADGLRIQLWNKAAESMYGLPRAEAIGSTVHDLWPSNEADLMHAADMELVAGGGGMQDFPDRVALTRDRGDIHLHLRKVGLLDAAGRMSHLLVIADDITARLAAARDLVESERRFSNLLQNVQLASVMLDTRARITYCNDYLLNLTGWRLEEILGRDWFELFVPDQIRDNPDFFPRLLASSPEAWHRENTIVTRGGERRLMHWNNSVLRSGAGEVIGSASIGEDITERTRAAASIVKLNRVYAVLSGINSLIVRVGGRDELFREACRIAVEEGKFALAWLGIVDRRAMALKVVASHDTTQGFVDLIRLDLSESAPGGLGLAGRVVFERKPIVINDVETDTDYTLRPEALARGFRSIVVLPLMDASGVIGVLSLYANTPDYFDQDEMKLLLELAGDISFAVDHLEKAERIRYLASYDALTGLANRSLFEERVARHIEGAEAQSHRLAVLVIDLERFKLINASLGRPAGDALLQQVAARVLRKEAHRELFARVGPDQFAMVMPAMQSAAGLAQRIERQLEEWFGERFTVCDTELKIAARVGVALYPNDGTEAGALLTNAEAALKKAKATGERHLFYTSRMSDTVAGRLTLENQLRQALERGEFVLHYQPKMVLETRRIESVEALIRWMNPKVGLVPPMQFIPLMEQTGLILDVGAWALGQAVADRRTMIELGLPLRVAVNVSPIQLRRRNFVTMVEQALRKGGVPPGIDLEITETLMMEDVEANIEKLKMIRSLGVNLAIDDFGTGYSSLGYLARLPADALKIDRSFIISMLGQPSAMTLVSTIISMAHSLHLKVIAEGVETAEQEKVLARLHCDQTQGYLVSPALPLVQMLSFTREWNLRATPAPARRR